MGEEAQDCNVEEEVNSKVCRRYPVPDRLQDLGFMLMSSLPVAMTHIAAMCHVHVSPDKNSTTTSTSTTLTANDTTLVPASYTSPTSINSTTGQTLVPVTPPPFQSSAASRYALVGVTIFLVAYAAVYITLRVTTHY